MALNTNFKDEILQTGKINREYDLVREDNTVVESNIKLIRKDTPQQVGSPYGAKQVNEANVYINQKYGPDNKPKWTDIDNKPESFPPGDNYLTADQTAASFVTILGAERNYVKKGQFTIISGSATFDNTNIPRVSLPYPSTFNKDNTVVISVMCRNTNQPYFTTGTYPTSLGYTISGIFTTVSFLDNALDIRLANPAAGLATSGSSTFEFKIVLMNI